MKAFLGLKNAKAGAYLALICFSLCSLNFDSISQNGSENNGTFRQLMNGNLQSKLGPILFANGSDHDPFSVFPEEIEIDEEEQEEVQSSSSKRSSKNASPYTNSDSKKGHHMTKDEDNNDNNEGEVDYFETAAKQDEETAAKQDEETAAKQDEETSASSLSESTEEESTTTTTNTTNPPSMHIPALNGLPSARPLTLPFNSPPNGIPPTYLPPRPPQPPPFFKHYSKSMVVVREWFTKTVGATMNGRRKQDEDALVVHAPHHSKNNVRFTAIFDGHGGYEVSRACATHFPSHFGNISALTKSSLTAACRSLDNAVTELDAVKRSRAGSTGIIVAIEKRKAKSKFKIHVTNVGDSRAFIVHKDGTYSIVSRDHKPNDVAELRRIQAAGGSVVKIRRIYRVNGTLALSRAFGDVRMKDVESLPSYKQKVIVDPDVRVFDASAGDYLIMACDGLFEARGMTWDFVANLFHHEMQITAGNTVETAFRMLNAAYLLGSADNISIMITSLMDEEKPEPAVKRFVYDFTGKRTVGQPTGPGVPNTTHHGEYVTPHGLFVTLF